MPEDVAPAIPSETVLDEALAQLDANASQQTDGVWLEDLTRDVALHLRDWNVDGCWRWEDWPYRDEVMPEGTPSVDVGKDFVARRRDDGAWIAIQVKSRKLNPQGVGNPVSSDEMNKFLAAASNADIWTERWMVVNGAVGSYLPSVCPAITRETPSPQKLYPNGKGVYTLFRAHQGQRGCSVSYVLLSGSCSKEASRVCTRRGGATQNP